MNYDQELQLWKATKFDAVTAYFQNTKRMDASQTIALQRQLTLLETRVQEVKYNNLMARVAFPVNNSGGAGLMSLNYPVLNKFGEAKVLSDSATDWPKVGVNMKEVPNRVVPIGISACYTELELERAARAGVPLETYKVDAANRGMESKLDKMAFFGDDDYQIKGLFSYSSQVTNFTIDNGVSGNNGFKDDLTPDEILDRILGLIRAAGEGTDYIEGLEPDTLMLTPEDKGIIMTTPRSEDNDVTIAQFILNSTSITSIVSSTRLKSVPQYSNNSVMLAYSRQPDVMELRIPRDKVAKPWVQMGREWVMDMIMDTAGLFLYHPKSVAIGEFDNKSA